MSQMQDFVENCRICASTAKVRKEPLLPTIVHPGINGQNFDGP